MAMRPVVGYNMGDYFKHWIERGAKTPNQPKIFNVNWFRTDDEGNFMWPGFGDNLRVLEWILDRCEDKVDAVETPIGFVPKAEDINIEGLNGVTKADIEELLAIDKESWKKETEGIEQFYTELGERVPKELWNELSELKAKLDK